MGEECEPLPIPPMRVRKKVSARSAVIKKGSLHGKLNTIAQKASVVSQTVWPARPF
jgi:hypothetical protein